MRSIGGLLLLFGIGSLVLDYFNIVFKVIAWIPSVVGEGNETWVYIGLAVVGAILYFLGNSDDEGEE